jgi:hypothetical protein
VVRPAKLGQRELDAGAGLLGPEEDCCGRKLQEVIAGLLRAWGLTVGTLSKKMARLREAILDDAAWNA